MDIKCQQYDVLNEWVHFHTSFTVYYYQQITDKGIRMGSETLLNFQQIVGVEGYFLFYFLCWTADKIYSTVNAPEFTSICLIRASSRREKSSEVSSGVRGVGSQSCASTISKLSSLVGAGLAATKGDGGTLWRKNKIRKHETK